MPERSGENIEVIRRDIVLGNSSTMYLYPLGDIHLGAIQCDEDDIERKVEEVRRQRDAYWIGMGDYSDCIPKDDKRFDGEGLAEWVDKGNIVESQRKRVVSLFSPIKDKCLGMLTGNHEETIHLHHQNNITRNICNDLGVKWAGYATFIDIHFSRPGSNEKHQYTIHAWHGAGAAQTFGARVQRLSRLVMATDADIYLMGHLHSMESLPPAKLGLRNGKVRQLPLIATITGSWIKTYAQGLPTGYGERQGYMPSALGCPTITIKPETNQIALHLSQMVSRALVAA